jgi:hypothetical protein
MTATYPLSVVRRIEQKWAERLKSAATRPAKAVGQIEATGNPGTTPGATPFSASPGPQSGDRSAA